MCLPLSVQGLFEQDGTPEHVVQPLGSLEFGWIRPYFAVCVATPLLNETRTLPLRLIQRHPMGNRALICALKRHKH